MVTRGKNLPPAPARTTTLVTNLLTETTMMLDLIHRTRSGQLQVREVTTTADDLGTVRITMVLSPKPPTTTETRRTLS